MSSSRMRQAKIIRRKDADNEREEGAKILPLRRGANINIGLVIFLFIFLYLAYSLIHFATKENYTTFQVGLPETLSEEQTYQALLLRTEQTVASDHAGYVDLFVEEGSRVSVGMDIASVDEVGSYSEQIREAMKDRSLAKEDLLRMKTALKDLSVSYDPMNFASVYERKSMLHATVLGSNVADLYTSIAGSTSAAEFFHVSECSISGIAAYYLDGFESKEVRDLTAADFDAAKYQRAVTGRVVAPGDFLYKIIPSENWKMAVPISEEEAASYGAYTSLNITFLKNGLKTTASSSVVTGADGGLYLQLELSRYMIRFIGDRFARIRISRSEESGFKLPKTALTTEELYMIPRDYQTDGGFIAVNYTDGGENVSLIDPDLAFTDEQYCYVELSKIEGGTILAKPDSAERYTVRLTAQMDGVYKIGKGYTEYCPVVIIDSSEDYVLVARNTERGLTSYETILLNAKGYRAGQILQ